MISLCTLASGSSGNCTYVGLGGQHFLVDAGISGKRIEHALQELKINIRDLSGVFVTHEHRDHITAVGVLARRFKIPVYATPFTWRYFLRHGVIGVVAEDLIRHIVPGQVLDIGGVAVTAFDISHDASQPAGYSFEFDEEKAVIATDLGHVTDTVRQHLKGAGVIMIESNHDPEMLERGPYPRQLKDRVAGNRGHLSNAAAGMLLVEAASTRLEYIVLAHLSEDNNSPMIAFDTVKRILDVNDVHVKQLIIAERHHIGEMVLYGD